MRVGHPSPYPKYILAEITKILRYEQRRAKLDRPLVVLDPMAGIGRIHDLDARIAVTFGVEIEPEWAIQRTGTTVGDATNLPASWADNFDAIVVSPVYGNRMSDHHEAKDSCAACGGIGVDATPDGCGEAPMLCPDCHDVACVCGGFGEAMRDHVSECSSCSKRRCKSCRGSGISRRYTYRHALGRPVSENSAGKLQWPTKEYRELHEKAWAEAFRVTSPGGLILVNVKDHVRGGVVQKVADWHKAALRSVGYRITGAHQVESSGLRHGENASKRVRHEQIIVARKPKTTAKRKAS